jgi:hypothetical protein
MPEFPVVEFVRDPYEEALTFCLPLSERHQVIRDPGWEWFRWLRRRTENPRLCTYRHRETGRFVVGAWAWSPSEAAVPLLQELEGFNGNPCTLWPSDLLDPSIMLARLQPVHNEYGRMRRRIADREAAKRAAREEDGIHKGEVVQWMKRRGLQKEAHDLATGAVPFSGRGHSPGGNAELVDELKLLRSLT